MYFAGAKRRKTAKRPSLLFWLPGKTCLESKSVDLIITHPRESLPLVDEVLGTAQTDQLKKLMEEYVTSAGTVRPSMSVSELVTR